MGAPKGNKNAAGKRKAKAAYSPFINPADMAGLRFGSGTIRTGRIKKARWHNPKRVTNFSRKRT